MEKAVKLLESTSMTIISGGFLLASLILMLSGKNYKLDPAWITIFISGIPMLYLALTRLFLEKWVSSALLISMAMSASIAIGEIFAAGEVAFIMAIGAILEEKTIARAQKGLSRVISLAPVKGRKLIQKNGKFVEKIIPAEKIRKGDRIRVLPGEKMPVDGIILSGNTSVDQSVITGESLPVDKEKGNRIFCGTMNCFGSIDMEALCQRKDSSLQKLIDMVKEAGENKAPMQRTVDKWAVWLVPIALFIAVFISLVTRLLGFETMDAINRGVTVLVVFCPCALALATPTSIMAAIGQAAKNGVIIKSGEALEKMGMADTIAFDKTGTLTSGKLEVSSIISFKENYTEEKILSLAASAEEKSEHPLAKAIVVHARKKRIDIISASSFKINSGKGVSAKAGGIDLLCGSKAYIESHGISINNSMKNSLEKLTLQGKALILIAANWECIGVIALSDILRPDANKIVKRLYALKTRVILLTGDNRKTADYFASRAGIREVYADLLPNEKVEIIKKLQHKGFCVSMTGDGINDAPALKTADTGLAMGSMGSDIAVEAADIALMGDDISKIPYLKKLSISTLNTIKLNITASMLINAAAIALSGFGLLTPVSGAIVHNVGSVIVVLNAALLYDRDFKGIEA